MKIKYLGTAAAEGVPAIFCHCDVCKYAREHRGKEIRTRAQAMIDDAVLIDFGPDTYSHLLNYNLDITELKHCLITHVHEDHFYPDELVYRQDGFANLKEGTEPLTIYGSKDISEKLHLDGKNEITKDGSVLFQELTAYQTIQLEDYKITAFPAYHGTSNPFFYAIEKDNKSILYAHDTDVFQEEVWDYFVKNQMHFDLVSLDCTGGLVHITYRGHMSFDRNLPIKERMIKSGIATEETVFVANHFSHNGNATYAAACEFASQHGMVISYDGMEIEV